MADKSLESIQLERDQLKQELERLHCELAQTSHEKIQSAQYGLVLLDEKEALQQKCEELEALYDATKHESDCLREALAKFQTSQKVSATTGIEQEESLLQETASKEASFTSTLQELERELKLVRQELARVEAEKERIQQENADLAKRCEIYDWEKKNLKTELKELKFREARLLGDNNELEEENISLQKQVSSLRSSQVEFEGAKHEVRRLQDVMESFNSQVEELTSLKKIAEKQLEEALEALQSEREQKYALKKELDQRLNSESIFNLNNLAFAGFHLGNMGQEDGNRTEEEDGEAGTPVLKQIEADFIVGTDEKGVGNVQSSTVGDLFSELHGSEIHKLEKQLEQAENEKSQLASRLQESQQLLEKTQKDLSDQHSRVSRMAEHINALIALHGRLDGEEGRIEGQMEDGEKDLPELSRLRQLLQKHEQRYQLAVQQVERLQADVKGLQQQGTSTDQNDDESLEKLLDEIANLKNKVRNNENQIANLESDMNILGEITGETQTSLNLTQEDLISISEELAQIYHHVCMVNGETPNRIMLDHVKGTQQSSDDGVKNDTSNCVISTSERSVTCNRMDALRENIKSEICLKILQSNGNTDIRVDPGMCTRLLETLHDQIKHLRRAVETTIEMQRQNAIHSSNRDGSFSSEVEDLQEQVIKLKSMLSTKREQIATLRTVLKANKQTAEVALTNLKSKYENEKTIVTETMMKLRNELKALKEDAATFASLRAMFAARCEEYVTQLDELQRQLTAAEEEKKTLNSLLRLAIQQKLALTQRLEDLEMDRERTHMRRHTGRSRPSYPRTSGGHHHLPPGASAFSSHQNYGHGQYYQRRDY
ncbi:protein bicaudal D isoform X1 [Centruroides vittatus]|uniref:protein bicaudal D isoform X1 n=1 Tax=Centruroides vittatus TaxID=120091 RepID=UPI00350F98D8